MSNTFTPIQIVHNQQTVLRKIEQADARMFVREFMQNALEAASAAGEAARVKWHVFRDEDEGDVPKLYVWNNGRGMTAIEMKERMNLFVSGTEKNQGTDGNFGIGAKLTGLRASSFGVLFRSCKNGRVTQMLLGMNDGIPGIKAIQDLTDFYSTKHLKDFDSKLYGKLGGQITTMLEFEWTMAVFLGHEVEQDTSIDPFCEGEAREDGEYFLPRNKPEGGRDFWLFKSLNRRFYDLTKWDVTTVVQPGKKSEQNRQCIGANDIRVDNEATVDRHYGKLRYCLLKEGEGENEDARGVTAHGIMVYKNEIFDGYFGNDAIKGWSRFALQVGIPAGHKRIAVQVLLNDDFPASPNEQRTSLQQYLNIRGARQDICLHDFAEDIELFMPDFLREFIAAEESKNIKSSDKVERATKEMMLDLGLLDPSAAQGDGDPAAEEPGNGKAKVVRPKRPSNPGSGGPRIGDSPARPRKRLYREGTPLFPVMQQSQGEPSVEWVPGSANGLVGVYDNYTNTIRLHHDHAVLNNVVKEMLNRGISDTYRATIEGYARDSIGIAAVAHILWAKHLAQTGQWGDDQYANATTPESLTASLGYYRRHLPAVESQCRGIRREKARG